MAIYHGTAGKDVYAGTSSDDSIFGEGGADQLSGGAGFDLIDGGSGADRIYGEADSDRLHGGAGTDLIDGGDGSDLLASDHLTGYYDQLPGDRRLDVDTLIGGTGDDSIVIGAGDFADGGEGMDYLSIDFRGATAGVEADLRPALSGGQSTVMGGLIEGFEVYAVIIGSSFDDAIIIGRNPRIWPYTPADLEGGGGDDTLTGGDSIEHFDGGAGDDLIVGFEGKDRFVGGPGADTMQGGGDRNQFFADGFDQVDCGGEYDVVHMDFSAAEAAVTADFRGIPHGGEITFSTGGAVTGFEEVRDLYGSRYGDHFDVGTFTNVWIEGRDGADTIVGSRAQDTISGGDGDDLIGGMGGLDRMTGGKGFDTVSYAGYDHAVIADFATHEVKIDHQLDTFSGFEGFIGTALADKLTGDAGRQALDGGAGDDELLGLGGSDTLAGGDGADRLRGGDGADVLTGGAGADRFVIAGGPTNDVDLITDLAADDVVDLSQLDARSTKNGDQAFELVDRFTHTAGEAVLTYRPGQDLTRLRMDVDGDGETDITLEMAGDHTGFAGWVL